MDKGTLYIGLNIVGGLVHNANEWKTRLTEQVEWTKDLIREYNTPDRVGQVVMCVRIDVLTRLERCVWIPLVCSLVLFSFFRP